MDKENIWIVSMLIVLLFSAGCIGPFANNGNQIDEPIDYISSDSDVVAEVNPDLLYKNSTERLVTKYTSLESDTTANRQTSRNYSDWKDYVEGNVSAVLNASSSVYLFAKADDIFLGDGYFGGIFVGNWQDTDPATLLEESTIDYTETTYKEETIYRLNDESSWGTHAAVLDNQSFIIGTKPAVRHTINVSTGNSDVFTGNMRNSFVGVQQADIRFSTTDPLSAVGPILNISSDSLGVFRNVEVASGSYSAENENINSNLEITTDSSSSAQQLMSQINLILIFMRNNDPEGVVNETISTSSEGSVVNFSLDGTVGDVIYIINLAEARDNSANDEQQMGNTSKTDTNNQSK